MTLYVGIWSYSFFLFLNVNFSKDVKFSKIKVKAAVFLPFFLYFSCSLTRMCFCLGLFMCQRSLKVLHLIFERHYHKSIKKKAVVLYCFYWL